MINVSIGARFSFLETGKPTNLYYDINGFVPSLWPGKKKFIKKIGLYASLSETNFQPPTESGTQSVGYDYKKTKYIYDSLVIPSTTPDSLSLVHHYFYRTYETKYNHQISLSLFPTIKLTDFLYANLYIEQIFSSSEVSFKDVLVGSDTSNIAMDINSKNIVNPFPYTISSGYKINGVNTFLGVGLFLNFDKKVFTFQMTPNFVYMDAFNYYYSYDGTKYIRKYDFLSYVFRFALIEHTTGIKIRGEVRGFLTKNPSQKSVNYSVYISKQFSLNKIADFLKTK